MIAEIDLDLEPIIQRLDQLQQEVETLRKAGRGIGPLLDRREAAAYLKIGLTTLWRLSKDGEIAGHMYCGQTLYSRADLDRFIERNRVPERRDLRKAS